MRARIVKIGNSQGVRIPKPLLDQTGIVDDVELEVRENQISCLSHVPEVGKKKQRLISSPRDLNQDRIIAFGISERFRLCQTLRQVLGEKYPIQYEFISL